MKFTINFKREWSGSGQIQKCGSATICETGKFHKFDVPEKTASVQAVTRK